MQNNNLTQVEEVLIESKYFKARLDDLLSVTQPAHYCLNLMIKLILHGPDGSGKRLLAKSASKHLGMTFYEENVADLFDENIVGTEKKVKAALLRLSGSAPCVIYFTSYQLFCQLDDIDLSRIESCISEFLDDLDNTQPIIFIAGTNDYQTVFRTGLSRMFHYDISLNPTNIEGARDMIQKLNDSLSLRLDISCIWNLSSDSELYIGNVIDILAKSHIEDYEHLSPIIHSSECCNDDQISMTGRNNIGWEDIGGLTKIKKEIIDAFKLSMDYPELKASGLRRNGILLYGPPGTGKTLLAKAVATECKLKFMSVKGPELLNEYVGQSEDNVRKVFEKARQSSPAVIFFDELDSLVPNRGQAGDSGGVMDRIVSQVCAEMDGVGQTGEVFVMGATNRVDLVDPSLLRPGRFDKILEVPLPTSKEDRLQILKALTRKMCLSKDVDLNTIESKLPKNLSGADLRRLCSVALERAFNRAIEQVKSGQATEDDVIIELIMEDFGSR